MEERNVVSKDTPIVLWIKPGTEYWGNISITGDVYVDDRCYIHGEITADNICFGNSCTAGRVTARGYFSCKDRNYLGRVIADESICVGKQNSFKDLCTAGYAVIGKDNEFENLIAGDDIHVEDGVKAYKLESERDIMIGSLCYISYVYSGGEVYIGAKSFTLDIEADSTVKMDIDASAEKVLTFGQAIISETAVVCDEVVASNVKVIDYDMPKCKYSILKREAQESGCTEENNNEVE